LQNDLIAKRLFIIMGIEFNKNIEITSDDDFHKLDYKITGLAFKVHDKLGRFWNELIYRNYLIEVCKQNGIDNVDFEIPITISYKNYSKRFYIDLLINNSIIYELKSVNKINNIHKRQVLNYLLLSGCNHAKLLNFGSQSVECEFVSTKLTPQLRRNYNVSLDKWLDVNNESAQLKQLIVDLLDEWGAFISTELYYDVIYFFFGGKENVLRPINVICNNNILGAQNTHLITSNTAFNISAITNDKKFYRNSLKKFLRHSSLKTIQWINLNHNNIEFETIIK
jgi:GxxExxY protein